MSGKLFNATVCCGNLKILCSLEGATRPLYNTWRRGKHWRFSFSHPISKIRRSIFADSTENPIQKDLHYKFRKNEVNFHQGFYTIRHFGSSPNDGNSGDPPDTDMLVESREGKGIRFPVGSRSEKPQTGKVETPVDPQVPKALDKSSKDGLDELGFGDKLDKGNWDTKETMDEVTGSLGSGQDNDKISNDVIGRKSSPPEASKSTGDKSSGGKPPGDNSSEGKDPAVVPTKPPSVPILPPRSAGFSHQPPTGPTPPAGPAGPSPSSPTPTKIPTNKAPTKQPPAPPSKSRTGSPPSKPPTGNKPPPKGPPPGKPPKGKTPPKGTPPPKGPPRGKPPQGKTPPPKGPPPGKPPQGKTPPPKGPPPGKPPTGKTPPPKGPPPGKPPTGKTPPSKGPPPGKPPTGSTPPGKGGAGDKSSGGQSSDQKRVITLMPGDGIGPEISMAVIQVLEAAGAPLIFEPVDVTPVMNKQGQTTVPEEVIESMNRTKVGLKGPLMTPVGTGFRSLNLTLRQLFNLYANVRPCRSLPGAETVYGGVDIVTIRENTEGEYSGIEHTLVNGVVQSIKLITRAASLRVAEYAFQYALAMKRKKVTVVAEKHVMRMSDGLFLRCVHEMAAKYKSKLDEAGIVFEETNMTTLCLNIVINPNKYDMLVLPNLYGDIISDTCAGLIGGLGLTPSGNVGEHGAIFESVHGTAPDIAGKDIANPTALLLSSVMMLHYIGMHEQADKIEQAILKTIRDDNVRTIDLGGKAKCSEFTNALIKNLK
ncbi:uncharacterized protein [Drosophila kikkawai]|uniref:isocitrate dehydrogenase (NAD(+)) n=1 Tax=Drosophila kikkawai TaxID=30033 RepID=A0A6P4IDG6_DROKI|nr:uncharacterized protein LOC108077502 [Drosophila kikkawai]